MRHPARWMIPLTVITLMLSAGCQSRESDSNPTTLNPADFDAITEDPPAGSPDAAPQSGAPVAQAPDAAEAPGSTPPETTAPADAADPSETGDADSADSADAPEDNASEDAGSEGDGSGDRLVVDAMVGQVNGEPIYAGEIFQRIGTEQLERIGEQQPRLAFRREARQLIISNLRSRVTNAMLLREAERDLSEKERRGLDAMLRQERKKILSEYGGVRALAEAGLKEKTGRTIEQELDARRKSILIERYMHQKFRPRVNVSRREVERYYRDHYSKYNASPTVTVRLIIAREDEAAERVQQALADGEPFAEIASRYSDVREEQGGLMPAFNLDGPFESFDALRWPELNKAVRKLEPGQHSDRVDLDIGAAWVMLEKLEGGKKQSLQDVFLEIERTLRSQKMNRLQQQHIRELMEEGNFTPLEEMVAGVLEVAMARYAKPPQ